MRQPGPIRAIFCLTTVLASGCAAMRNVPVIGRFFPPPYYHYIDNPKFSCEYPRKWTGPKPVEGGASWTSPDGLASYSIAFFEPAAKGYALPDRYRQDMTSWGSVEDAHRLDEIAVSSRTAYRVRFTTHQYDPQYLLGTRSEVFSTETILVEDPKGIVVIVYRTPADRFWKRSYRSKYEYFLKSIVVAVPPKPTGIVH